MPFWTAQIPVLYSTVWSDCTLETDRAGHTTRGRCLGDDCPDTGDACVHGWACLDRCPAGPCCAPGGRGPAGTVVSRVWVTMSVRACVLSQPPYRSTAAAAGAPLSNCAPLSPCVHNVTPGPPARLHSARRVPTARRSVPPFVADYNQWRNWVGWSRV